MFKINTIVLFYQNLKRTWAVATNDTRMAIIKVRLQNAPKAFFYFSFFSFFSSEPGDCQEYSPAGDTYEPRPLEEWHVSVPKTILHLCIELLYLYLWHFVFVFVTLMSLAHWKSDMCLLSVPICICVLNSDLCICALGKTSIEKKTFSFGHCPNEGGGGLPMPEFLALFQEVHFWSIKRVYIFKNANVLNF